MKRELVLIHGRSQQGKNADALKQEWLDALSTGLSKNGLKLPASVKVRFPYYGDTLAQLTEGKSADEAAAVIVRGTAGPDPGAAFARAYVEEVRKKAGISKAQLIEIAGQDVIKRGPANWEWVQSVLKAIDRFVPFGSGSSIALFTQDVYVYLKNTAIRERIDNGVAAAITPGVETVVVGHSLGSVVAYNVVRQRGHLQGWKVPLFVTVGSPLGVKEIRKTVNTLATARCPECAGGWFNAMDERDVVALYPLDKKNFPIAPLKPAIQNKTNVDNPTENRHGISGYLGDPEVARRIHAALTA